MQLNLTELNTVSMVLRVLLSVLLGGMLGLERTSKRRPAGMRTYMLVCLGAATAMMTGLYLYNSYGSITDPARIASQVITGVGFLGAGTIMTTRYHRVKGLTTAAGLWVAACIGLAVGVGWYLGAAVIALASLFVMVVANHFEQLYAIKTREFRVHMIIQNADYLPQILMKFNELRIVIAEIETGEEVTEKTVNLLMTLKCYHRQNHITILQEIREMDGVLLVQELQHPE